MYSSIILGFQLHFADTDAAFKVVVTNQSRGQNETLSFLEPVEFPSQC